MKSLRGRQASSQRGISSIVVVALVFLTLGLVFSVILLFAGVAEKERAVKALVQREDLLNAEQARIKKEKELSLSPTGIERPKQPATPDAVEAPDALPVDEARKVLVQRRKKYFPVSRSDAEKKDLGDPDLYNTLEELVALAAGRVVQAMNRADQKMLELDRAEDRKNAQAERKGTLAGKAVDYTAELEERIQKVSKEISDLKERIEINPDDKKKTQIEILQDQIAAVDEKIKAFRSDYGKMDTDFRNRIHKLQGELDDLKVKEVIRLEISQTHGKVLSPDIPNKIAFIDIGSRERVVPGLKFFVGKKGEQGKFQAKGKLLVKKVWMTYAEVAIAEIYDRNTPIVDGDVIVNPLFHKERPVVVHFIGEREPRRLRPNWSVNEATRRILEIGSEVRDRLTLDVDFVVFTEPKPNTDRKQDDGYNRAVLLGIPVEEASEIFKYLED